MIKKVLPGLLAAVVAIAAISFKEAPVKTTTGYWFTYNGSGSGQNLASSYSPEGATHTMCPLSNSLCSIYIATDDDGVLTDEEVQDLIDAERGGTGYSSFAGQSAAVDYKQ